MNKSESSSIGKKKLTPKEIKEKLTDDSLDLSVCGIEVVPVKEIADLSKVRKLNLSFNLLVSLPDDFIKLQLIRELDLSKNKLRSLPKNFGTLVNLKNLDLLGNELTMLPASFCELKALQWLDLKDNPLSEGLKKAAGDCFNEAQCKKCATGVVAYMKQVAAEEERRRQLELKKKREEQAKKDAEEKEKADLVREQKKIEREERRRVNEQKRQHIFEHEKTPLTESNGNGVSRNGYGKAHGDKDNKHANKSKSLAGRLFSAVTFVLILAVVVALLFVLFSNTCSKGAAAGTTSGSVNLKFRQTLDQQKWLKPVLDLVDKHVCPSVVRYRPVIRNLIKPLDLV